ncbi:MAG: rhomboid family intramembrane serine protease [Planctomycetaceae bacterium]|nr:rhomboid family intramembrane serine protease [Planctomycetaceae bacterium]
MRELVSFHDRDEAESVVCLMLAEKIGIQVTEDSGQWVMWVEHDDDRERAGRLVQEYQANPKARRFQSVIAQVQEEHRQQQQTKKGRLSREERQRLQQRAAAPWYLRSPVSWLLIALSCLMAIITTDWEKGESSPWNVPVLCNDLDSKILSASFVAPFQREEIDGKVQVLYSISPTAPFDDHEWWRLVSPVFIHLDVLHLLFNMMWVWQLAPAIEITRGSLRLLILTLVVAALSNLAQFYTTGPGFGGMSGVIFGLVGYAWMRGFTLPERGLVIRPLAMLWVILWLVLCSTGAMGAVANIAHVSGLVLGMIIGTQEAAFRLVFGLFRTFLFSLRGGSGGNTSGREQRT